MSCISDIWAPGSALFFFLLSLLLLLLLLLTSISLFKNAPHTAPLKRCMAISSSKPMCFLLDRAFGFNTVDMTFLEIIVLIFLSVCVCFFLLDEPYINTLNMCSISTADTDSVCLLFFLPLLLGILNTEFLLIVVR